MRYISLLEFRPGLTATIVAPSSYLEKTNGTLAQDNCLLRVDDNGFIVSTKQASPMDTKILLLGGSSIENLYIPDERRIGTRMEDILGKIGYSAKVYNAGISNAHLLHIINILLNKGIALRPKYIVLYSVPGLDVSANEWDNTFWNPDGSMSPLRVANQDPKSTPLTGFKNRNKFDDEKRLLRSLYDICRNFDIRLLVTTWPIYGAYDTFMEKYQPDKRMFEEEQEQMINFNKAVREACAEKQCPLIDLEKIFISLNHHEYFYDWNHPNIQGCEMIASLTIKAIQENL
jgi:hypothetical protein